MQMLKNNMLIDNTEEIEIDKIINFIDYPNLHSCISQKYPLWFPILLTKYDIYSESCINCRLYYLKFSKHIICSGCTIKIQKEIDDFEKFIDHKYNIFQNKNGIYDRIKLIMFIHRNELMCKHFTPCGIYLYYNKLCLSIKTIYKLAKITSESCLNNNDFDLLSDTNGAFDKKLMKALKKGQEICPEIFIQYHYMDLYEKLNKYHRKFL